MAERLNAPVLKTGDGVTRPGVRIPPPPLPASASAPGGDIVSALPYRIATLIYIFDGHGKTFLLERRRAPNLGLLSPIGGKLEQENGESPYQCAARELAEEAGIHVPVSALRLMGIIAERGFEGTGHWLMFCFELVTPILPAEREMPEGAMRWIELAVLDSLNIPKTDRDVIWPLVRSHSHRLGNTASEVFSAFIDCTGRDELKVNIERA